MQTKDSRAKQSGLLPVFPTDPMNQCNGLTLRDYFAAQALAGLLARSDVRVPHCASCCVVEDDAGKHYAEISYRYADAMLAARERA